MRHKRTEKLWGLELQLSEYLRMNHVSEDTKSKEYLLDSVTT